MNKLPFLLLAAVSVMTAPADAQQHVESLGVSEYLEAQINVVNSAAQLLNIKSIANAPQEVAAGINQLTGILHQLRAAKPHTDAADNARMQTEMGQEAQTAAATLHQALATTIKNDFYHCQELVEALQQFANALQKL